MEVVRLASNDWKEIRELRLRMVQEEPAFGKTYQEELAVSEVEWKEKISQSVYYGAREKGKLIGLLCTVRERAKKHDHIAKIYSVYVVPEMRGNKISSRLLEEALRDLKDSGIVKAKLHVVTSQKAAQTVYENYGFKIVGTLQKEINVNGELQDVYVMERLFNT